MAQKIIKNSVELRVVNNDCIELTLMSGVIGREIDANSKATKAILVFKTNGVVDILGYEVKSKSNNGQYEIIDFLNPKDILEPSHINITEEINCIIKNNSEEVVLQISGSNARSVFNVDMDIKIDYMPERIMYDNNAYCDLDGGTAGIGRINLANGNLNFVHNDGSTSGIGHVYNTWQSNMTSTDFADVNNLMVASENHNYYCGKSWKLNLHQYLIKHTDADKQVLYTYIDDNGNYHEFSEKYYYVDNDQKHYVDKKIVQIGYDGDLSFDGKKIKTELKSTSGLMLRPNYKGFAGADKLELRHEDIAKLEEEIEQLNDYKAELNYNIAVHQLQADTFEIQKAIERGSLELDAYSQDLNKTLKAHNILVRDKSLQVEKSASDLEYNSLLDKGEYDFANNESYYKEQAIKALKELNAISARHNVFEGDATAQFVVDENDKWQINYLEYDSVQKHKKNQLYADLMQQKALYDTMNNISLNANGSPEFQHTVGKYSYYNERYSQSVKVKQDIYSQCLEKYEELCWDKQKYINALKREFLYLKNELLKLNGTNFDAQEQQLVALREAIIVSQGKVNELKNKAQFDIKEKDRIEYLLNKYKIDLDKADKTLGLKTEALKSTRLLTPDNVIVDRDCNLIFNCLGRLIAVVDNNENTMFIVYDDDKITSVESSDGKVNTLEYNNDLLCKIIDMEDKVYKFEYNDGELSKIIYPDGTFSEYEYTTDLKLLQTATNPSGYGVKFSYDYQRIVKTEEYALMSDISSDECLCFDNGVSTQLLAQIAYNTHLSTTITDRLGNHRTYIFDILGKPITVYEGVYSEPGENTKALSVDYNGNNMTFSITDNANYPNILANIAPNSDTLNGTPNQARQRIFNIDLATIPEGATDLVFSAWARADSSCIASQRLTDYSVNSFDAEHIQSSDSFKSKRKFELRAELSFDNRTTRNFSASFDWLNTDWQYLVLPITIISKNQVGDRLDSKFPFILGEQDSQLLSLTIVLDYSYNTNQIELDCLALRQGSWKYSQFDHDGKRIREIDSNSGTTIDYSYDKSGNLIASLLKDRNNREYPKFYKYNKQNRLISTTDHNGLCEEIVYDDKGNITKSFTYNISDPTSKFYDESVRDDKGKILADIDITGEFNAVEYEYDHTGAVSVAKDAGGGKTAYGYHNDQLVSLSSDCSGMENKNEIQRTLGYVTKVNSDGVEYSYTYDGWGRQKAVLIGGEEYSSTQYVDDYVTQVDYATGENFTVVKDNRSNVVLTQYSNGVDSHTLLENIYDDEGLLINSIDKSGQQWYNTDYTYDELGRVISWIEDGYGSIEQDIEYNQSGEVRCNRFTINDLDIMDYSYEYDGSPDGELTKISLAGCMEQELRYDGLGRLVGVDSVLTKDIYYAKYGDHATNYVNSVWHGVNGKRDENTRYKYDKNGNIISVSNDKEQTNYTYDSLNRLIREDNKALTKTQVYEYDNKGNILSRTQYPYTTSQALSGGTQTKYGYSQKGNRDRLISFGGEEIGQYDAIGNPHIYAQSGYEELAERNSIRYRGYYYDITTRLYYLNSRYYDPTTGRFINADDISYLDPETIGGTFMTH